MNIYSIDLNLLKIFESVYVERNVSRAAVRLGLTQPSVSNGLTRLRSLLGDPLFVRVSGGVEPTVVAERIAPSIQQMMRSFQATLDEAIHFDETTSVRTFRFHMSDFGEVVFLPAIMRELNKRAPGLRVETRQFPASDIGPALESGQIDFAIGYLPMLETDFQCEKLFEEEYVIAKSRAAGNDEFSDPADIYSANYIAVTSHPESLKLLELAGLGARVRLSVPHFMVVPPILAETNFSIILPSKVFDVFSRVQQANALQLQKLPFESRPLSVSLYWFRRYSTDPGNIWLRNIIAQAFKV